MLYCYFIKFSDLPRPRTMIVRLRTVQRWSELFLILNLNCSTREDFWSSHDTSTSFELLLLESVGQVIFEILKIKCSLLSFFGDGLILISNSKILIDLEKNWNSEQLKWLTMSISVQLSTNEHSVFLIAPISIQIQFIFRIWETWDSERKWQWKRRNYFHSGIA